MAIKTQMKLTKFELEIMEAVWALGSGSVREIQEQLPEAHAVLRHHLLLSRRHQGVPSIVIIGALVTVKYGPFVLRREYIVSDKQSAAVSATEVDRN